MPPPITDREALIVALAAQARSDAPAGPDPEPEELLDYLAGRLSPEDEQRVSRQLAASPAAARALLDLADLEASGAAAATAGDRPADLPAVAGWRELKGRLPGNRPWTRRLTALLPAAAASLLMTTVGLGAWVVRLQSALQSPVANLQTLDLPSAVRADTEPAVELPAGAPLRLVLDPAERCPGYTAEIEGPGRGDRRPVEGLERNELGQLNVLLPSPGPGAYRLLLAGCEPRRTLEEHRFRIARPDG